MFSGYSQFYNSFKALYNQISTSSAEPKALSARVFHSHDRLSHDCQKDTRGGLERYGGTFSKTLFCFSWTFWKMSLNAFRISAADLDFGANKFRRNLENCNVCTIAWHRLLYPKPNLFLILSCTFLENPDTKQPMPV